jgi:hypothetical protein
LDVLEGGGGDIEPKVDIRFRLLWLGCPTGPEAEWADPMRAHLLPAKGFAGRDLVMDMVHRAISDLSFP